MIARLALLPLLLIGCNETLSFEEDFDSGPADVAAEASGCVQNGCPLETLRCDPSTGRCEECVLDGDCPFPLTRCEPTTHKCYGCLEEGDCPPATTCVLSVRRCIRTCVTRDQCPPGHWCDTARSLCVSCASSSQCFDPRRRVCHGGTGRCEECARDSDCPSTNPRCDPATLRCYVCLGHSDCAAPRLCDPSRHICITPT